MQRDIFSSKIDDLQQGCIFYGAIADGIQHPVHGLVITPRCDIANNKVLNINYLPITSLTDWFVNDLIPAFRAEEGAKLRNDLTNQMHKRGININLNKEYKIPDYSIKQLFPDAKDSQIVENLISYWNLFDQDICKKKIKDWKNYNNRIAELCHGKMERYILLEDWDNSKDIYYVINLTQVKHISYDTFKNLIVGIVPRLIDLEKDDLYFEEKPSVAKYKVVAKLTSPYIEYVCQKFSNAFFRIGIEDWPHKKITDAVKNTL